MLMLIEFASCSATDKEHFNTSHVNVNHKQKSNKINIMTYFNTSHVNVNPAGKKPNNSLKKFQYISC